jgi:hypothetical protein
MAGESHTTTDHNEIREWVEARGGQPATVRRTGNADEPGVLRIDFPGYSGSDSLEAISWEEFFDKFDEKNLAFLYQEQTRDGKESRFFKLVSQDTADEVEDRKKTSHKTEHKAEHKTEHKDMHKAEAKHDTKTEHKDTHKAEHKKETAKAKK